MLFDSMGVRDMAEQGQVYVVGGDAGSVLDLIPVAATLKERGVLVTWIADVGPQAQAGRVLDRYGIPYEVHGPSIADDPRVILVACSTKAIDAQLSWTAWGRQRRVMGGQTTYAIWYDDLFGNAVRPTVLMGAAPDVVLVINDQAAKIVKSRRPTVETVVVGKDPAGIADPEALQQQPGAAQRIADEAMKYL